MDVSFIHKLIVLSAVPELTVKCENILKDIYEKKRRKKTQHAQLTYIYTKGHRRYLASYASTDLWNTVKYTIST